MTEPTISTTVRTTIPVARAELFEWFIPIELPRILHGYGPVPAVADTSGQTGPWDQVGSARTVHLADGNSAREAVTACERPELFAYRVWELTSPIARLADHARGQFRFSENASGSTGVSWTYTFVARSAPARVALAPVVKLPWRRFMARGLGEMSRLAQLELTQSAAGGR
jgi:hypothetical protein